MTTLLGGDEGRPLNGSGIMTRRANDDDRSLSYGRKTVRRYSNDGISFKQKNDPLRP